MSDVSARSARWINNLPRPALTKTMGTLLAKKMHLEEIKMPIVNVNDVALNYRESGDRRKRTIVFSHTLLWGSEVFDGLISEFESDFHIINVDSHGHGQSSYRTPLTLEAMAADYHQLLGCVDAKKLNCST